MKKYATPFDAIFADNKSKDKQDKNKTGREEPCGSELLQREKARRINSTEEARRMTPFIQIVFEEIEEYGLYDHKLKLFNLMEAALNGASGKARKEIDELWLEIQDHKEQLAIPPTESELLARNPDMVV